MINYYNDNLSVINKIKEFKENYTPEQAIKWYTRDTFVFRVLNKAFR